MFTRLFDLNGDGKMDAAESALEYMKFRAIMGEDESEETPNIYNINIDMSYKNKLEDDNKIYNFTNYGARFITTPQLIDDKTNLDIYGNTLMGKR